jgi:hypothetical protein
MQFAGWVLELKSHEFYGHSDGLYKAMPVYDLLRKVIFSLYQMHSTFENVLWLRKINLEISMDLYVLRAHENENVVLCAPPHCMLLRKYMYVNVSKPVIMNNKKQL